MSGRLAEGTVFAGRYQIVRCLAEGGMGAVYEAVHLETRRKRALKVMHSHLFRSAEMRERFQREARIAADVESEHIVEVSDAGVDEPTGMPFLVMDLLRGEELGDRLTRIGRLTPAEAITHLGQVASALEQTHARGIVHRDLKPENLFVTTRDDGSTRIKILDFGVAKMVAETGAGVTRGLGTPLYMAPEQFRTVARITPAADLYALGLTAYTMLVGAAYWDQEADSAPDMIAFALAASQGPKEPACARAARAGVTLPPAFDAWFAQATALEPEARFSGAAVAVRALAEVFGLTATVGLLPPASLALAATSAVPLPSVAGPPTLVAAAPAPSAGPARRLPVIALAVAGLAVAGGVTLAAVGRSTGPAPTTLPVVTAAATTPPPPTAVPSVEPAPSAPLPAPSASAPASPGPRPVPSGRAPAPKPTSAPAAPSVPLFGRD